MDDQSAASSEMVFPAEWSRVGSGGLSWCICTLHQVHWEYLKDLCLGWYIISLRKGWRNNSWLCYCFLCKGFLRNYPVNSLQLPGSESDLHFLANSGAKDPAGHSFVSVLGEMGASPLQRDAEGTRATCEMLVRERCPSWEPWLVGRGRARDW